MPEEPSSGQAPPPICSLQDFLAHAANIDEEIQQNDDKTYEEYYEHLVGQNQECDNLLAHIDTALDKLQLLSTEYDFVATNTSTLHVESEKLIQDQTQLTKVHEDVSHRLHYFAQVEQLLQRLDSPTLSVSGENFWQLVNQIDEGLHFLQSNKQQRDANQYIVKYRQCLSKAAAMIKAYVAHLLTTATDQVLKQNPGSQAKATPESAFALFYGKFKAYASKVRYVTDSIQRRRATLTDYDRIMECLEQNYLDHRNNLLSEGVAASLRDLTAKNKSDHCALVRQSCAFLVNICLDEYHLFYEFFPVHDDLLTTYLQGLCVLLSDHLLSCVININHLETLAEICSILRVEMLEEHVQHNRELFKHRETYVMQWEWAN